MSHSDRFTRLSQLLAELKPYWQFVPFDCLELPWQEPALCQWLQQHSLSELTALRQDAAQLQAQLSPVLPWLAELTELAEANPVQGAAQAYPARLDWQIPGRKWQQITAFSDALAERHRPWLEWCAGKGHLGRALAATSDQPVVSLEWQAGLCEEGQALATRFGLPMTFVNGDAFDDSAANHLKQHQHAVALHACGDLHVALLRHGARAGTEAISFSPCCYHLIRSDRYRPLSQAAQARDLNLSKLDLKMPLQETVTAPGHVKRQRQLELSYRLGFDCLQRQLTGQDQYLPLPNVPKSLLGEGFEAFCQWAAQRKGLVLPMEGPELEPYLSQGQSRLPVLEQMETVRQLFRRPLELWLVLDRVCFLEEQGYEVDISTFCDRQMTPRNLLVRATKSG
ncbi:methyltransferase [Ferrimonas kyonanensis]|uniref:methyltransferase n=1 Tax=Ferrimonas kyonanensis TaxID=364763 RepID=UPI0003F7AF10|nr:methyltransferase [Ferrimonas kyonanensis]